MQFLCSRQQCTFFAIKACKVNAHVPLNAKFNLLAVKSCTVEHLGIFFLNQNIYLSINLGKKKKVERRKYTNIYFDHSTMFCFIRGIESHNVVKTGH